MDLLGGSWNQTLPWVLSQSTVLNFNNTQCKDSDVCKIVQMVFNRLSGFMSTQGTSRKVRVNETSLQSRGRHCWLWQQRAGTDPRGGWDPRPDVQWGKGRPAASPEQLFCGGAGALPCIPGHPPPRGQACHLLSWGSSPVTPPAAMVHALTQASPCARSTVSAQGRALARVTSPGSQWGPILGSWLQLRGCPACSFCPCPSAKPLHKARQRDKAPFPLKPGCLKLGFAVNFLGVFPVKATGS